MWQGVKLGSITGYGVIDESYLFAWPWWVWATWGNLSSI